MWALFDHWQFLAGLGIFLFGMYLLEESVKLLAGRSLRTLIRRATDTRLKGLLVGITTTALLQSSSAVSLMVLAFVGAGLMSLANAVAVILGTNIGTTATAWIVALAGFELKIDALALPLIDLNAVDVQKLPKNIVDSRTASQYQVIVLGKRGSRLFIGAADPTDAEVVECIKFTTQLTPEWVIVE